MALNPNALPFDPEESMIRQILLVEIQMLNIQLMDEHNKINKLDQKILIVKSKIELIQVN